MKIWKKAADVVDVVAVQNDDNSKHDHDYGSESTMKIIDVNDDDEDDNDF